ncbi:nucleotidyltransferase family protein [Actinoplanes sp. NPDC023714]|uniref:nucleotidyltransferase family protein n=1 Tax=Actinoplanes sp. NPDC023714 TaxID=3154322 RepID=UPI0033DC7E81
MTVTAPPPRAIDDPKVSSLLWAAGRDDVTPDLGAVDPDELFTALHAHRLDGRFWTRIRDSEHGRRHPGLARRAEERIRDIRTQVRRRAELTRRLAAALREDGGTQPLIPLKGFTLMALTGDPDAVRYSGDLDVVPDDPAALARVARGLGFAVQGPTEVLDEYARMVAPDHGMIEIHSYFPVPHWSPLPAGAVDPAAHPGAWAHEVALPHHHVRFTDLAPHLVPSAPVTAPDGTALLPPGIAVLRPEAAVLIQAAHLFGDYVRTVFPLPAGTIRLDELASVRRMCALPGFDPAVLRALIDVTRSADIVGFLRAASLDLLGHDPFAAALGTFQRPAVLPVDLWWDGVEGFLTDLGWHPGELVVRREGPLDVLRRLGTAALTVPVGGPAVTVAVPGDGGARAPRVIHRSRPGQPLTGHVELSAGRHALSIELSVSAAEPGWMTAVSCNFGDHRWEVFFHGPDQPVQFDDYSIADLPAGGAGRDATASAHREEGRDVIRVEIPWHRLDDPHHRSGPLALLLGLRRQEMPWGATAAGVILPLELRF